MLCSNCSQKIKPVVAVDIDGTLGDYHAHFIRFAETYLDKKLPTGYDGSREFSDFLKLDKPVYREIKLAYRQGGMKRSMPVFHHAPFFINKLRQEGVEVWITTTRPYLRLDNIDPDTRHWLSRHDIGYDGLLFNEDKYDVLVGLVDRDRIVAVIDDQRPNLDAASRLGLKTFFWRTRWNRAVNAEGHTNVTEYPELFGLIGYELEAWGGK